MLRRWLNKLPVYALALALAIAPVPAQEFFPSHGFMLAGGGGVPEPTTPTLFRAASCSYDSTSASSYNHTLTFPGVDDNWRGFIYVIFIQTDGATAYGVNSATFDGVSASEAQDDNGVQLVSTTAYRTNNASPVTGASSVAISVTMSESVTGSTACGWFFVGDTGTLTTDSTPHASNNTGASIALTAATTNSSGFAIGVCSALSGQTFTWSVLSEISDTSQVDVSYSPADAAATGSSMSIACDPSGATASSGMAIAFH